MQVIRNYEEVFMEYLTILIRTIICYSILVLSLRIMGKREIGQLSLFDLIILLSIADIMVIGIEKYNENFLYVILPVIMMTLLQKLVAYISLKFVSVRRVMDGSPSIIILNGKLLKEEMTKQSYNIEDLLLQLRNQGIFSIEEVYFAVLETNGKLSILKNSECNDVFPMPIILSGKIDYKTLKFSGKNTEWLTKELGKNHLVKKNILCAFVKKDELIWL